MEFDFGDGDDLDLEKEAGTEPTLPSARSGATKLNFDGPVEGLEIDTLGPQLVAEEALKTTPQKFKQEKDLARKTGLPVDTVAADDGSLANQVRAKETVDKLAEVPAVSAWYTRTQSNANSASQDTDYLVNAGKLAVGLYQAQDAAVDWMSNVARGAGEGFLNNIVGGFTRQTGTIADSLADYLEKNVVDLGRIEYNFTGSGPMVSWRPSTDEDIEQKSPLIKYAKDFEDAKLGYKPGVTWDDFLEAPAALWIPYAIETGLVSFPDMVATLRNLPAYIAARSGSIGQKRAENDKRADATAGDILNAMPYAISTALLEKIGAKGVFGLADDALKGVGKKAVAKAAVKGAVKEGITEGIQEPIEYAGESLGTLKGFKVDEAIQRSLQGIVVGTGFGGSIRTGTAIAESQTKARQARERAEGFRELNATESALRDTDPEAWADFQSSMMEDAGVDGVRLSEEGAELLMQEMEAFPEQLKLDLTPSLSGKMDASSGTSLSPQQFWKLPKETIDKLAEHVSFDVNQMSAVEAEEVSSLTELMSSEGFMAEVAAELASVEIDTDLFVEIEQSIMQTGGALTADPAAARAAAQQMAAVFTTMAKRTGVPLQKIKDRFLPRIEGATGQPAAATLEQPVSELTDVNLEELLVATEAQVKKRPAGSLDVYPAAMPPEYAFSNYEAVGGRMVEFTPDQFLALSSDMPIDAEVRENADDLAQMMLDGQRIDPPYLVVRDDGVVDSHDGRHRALAAKQLGIGKIPVLLMGEGGTAFPSTVRSIRPQLGSRDPSFVGTLEQGGGFEAYRNIVDPEGRTIPAEDRPNLRMGDMYGMLPKDAEVVGELDDVILHRGANGDYYATAYNADLGEQDVVGFIQGRENGTELAVVEEMQGKGIGSELQYLFRRENPLAPTGGLTEAGASRLESTYDRLAAEYMDPLEQSAINSAEIELSKGFKDERIPELEEAARQRSAGEITQAEYDAKVNDLKPIRPYTSVPTPATVEEMRSALKQGQQGRVGQGSQFVGEDVGMRLDIPAYTNHGTWVPTMHNPAGKPIAHEAAAQISDVVFTQPGDSAERKAARVGTGEVSKSPFAQMNGTLQSVDPDQLAARAAEVINDPEWTQVGYDPRRHTFFYDRATQQPVLSADEVIQVGPLVLAKNAQFGAGQNFLFQDSVENKRETKQDERVADKNAHGLMPYLRDYSEAEPRRTKKQALGQTTTNKNARKQLDQVDEILELNPDAHTSAEAWLQMMADAYGTQDVPIAPYRFIEEINGTGAVDNLSRLSEGQIEDANHGFENAAAFREAYTSGKLGVETTAKLFLWSFLSRGVSPYTQEALFIDAFPGIDPWIKQAAAGQLDVEAFSEWAKTAAPKGSGQPGAGSTHNLNAFGRDFLVKMSQPMEGSNQSKLEYIHELMSDPNSTGQQVRREFAALGEGVGIDNKVVSFTLLVAGYNDVLVLDRVQFRQLYNDGRFDGVNIYDGFKEDGKVVTASGFSKQGDGARGILIYEAMERAVAGRIDEIYTELGREGEGSVGRYHWETWVADSQQEASHGSLGAILPAALGDNTAINKVSAKQGEYGSYAYGARYGVDGAGIGYFTYPTPNGNVWLFTIDQFVEFQQEVRKARNGVVPTKFKVTEAGNAPWYTSEEVNVENLDQLAESISSGKAGDGAGTLFQDGADQLISDRLPADPALEQQDPTQEVDFVGDVIFEVAPDPNNVELSARWNALPPAAQLAISDTVSKSVLPSVLEAAGAEGSVSPQIGSYLEDTNPSFSLRLTSGDPAAVANAVGFVLSQDSMVALSADAFEGSFEAGAVRIAVGDKSLQEIDAIYQTLRGIDGFPQIGGQSTTDGQMTLILEEGVDVEAFSDAVVEALPSEYTDAVLFNAVNVAFPEKKDYDYGSSER